MAKYYVGNETWDQIDGTWENIFSLWDNDSDGEFQISEKINSWLNKNRDLKDRGILLDAIRNQCRYFIHENPKDYNKIPHEFFIEFNLVCIDLLSVEIAEFTTLFQND
jgi:hypothetical protein